MEGVRRFVLTAAGLALLGVACGGPAPSPSPSASPGSTVAAASPSGSVVPSARPEPTSSSVSERPIASSGSIAVLTSDASLSIIEADGRSVPISDDADGNFGFPTWSPDGSRIAAVRSSAGETSLVVFDAAGAASGPPPEPVVIFQKPAVEPFYLFWTPDGEAVSFLASEGDGLSMRIAPADGSAPVDGSGPGAIVRSGNPFYYDWIERDRLLAHIGVGPDAVLGEIGLDGKAAAPGLGSPGDFRSAAVSHDGKSIAFVLSAETGPDQVVVAARDGSGKHTMAVFGTSAVAFSPSGDAIASIGPVEAGAPAGFPLGPLRLIDVASGKVRTLNDGAIVSFWWSPDGKTIAALRLRNTPASTSSPNTSSPDPSSAAEAAARLLFVDVATGKVRSDPAVRPAPTFINGILAFFDQYALSHRVWAPDSSSVLMPEFAPDGTTHLTVHFPDGEAPIELPGEIGFWTPPQSP